MIQWSRVAELRDEIGEDGFDEVVVLFLEEVEGAIAELTLSDDLPEQMHFLKGSALNLGFRDLAEMCQKFEELSGNGDSSMISLGEVSQVYTRSKTEFLSGLAERFAA